MCVHEEMPFGSVCVCLYVCMHFYMCVSMCVQ